MWQKAITCFSYNRIPQNASPPPPPPPPTNSRSCGQPKNNSNFTPPTLKTFWRPVVARAIGCPQMHFFPTKSRSSGQPKNNANALPPPPPHPPSPLPGNFCNCNIVAFVLFRNSRFNFHCYTQRETTPTQKSPNSRKRWCSSIHFSAM